MSDLQVCMCGNQAGYGHTDACPFPYYGNSDKKMAEWEKAKVAQPAPSPAEVTEPGRSVDWRAVAETMSKALNTIGYEPIGHAEATHAEVLQGCTDIARAALTAYRAALAAEAEGPATK